MRSLTVMPGSSGYSPAARTCPVTRTMFDGNFMAQSLTELEYAAKRRTAEEKYVHSLTVLLEAIKTVPIVT